MTERAPDDAPGDAPSDAPSDAADAGDTELSPAPVPLTEPRDGVPVPLTTPEELAAAVEALRAGPSERLPIAIDAERASGYRYGQRAYLVQLRRADVGTMLFDPVYLPDLTTLGAVIRDDEWVLHAASQDLPCLAEVGLHATRVFDTELAGRLLGYAKVGLGSIVEEVLGLSLEKGHSAADWSTRPLPEPWVRYAALDVEVLVELRDRLAAQLDETGKRGWAEEEFAAIVAAQPAAPRVEAWRRTSGMHRVRRRRDLAIVRALWVRRDELAQHRDISPGRVLPDLAIVEAALAGPTTDEELVKLPLWGGRSLRRQATTWLPAVAEAAALPESELPEVKARHDGPPPARSWVERDPAAAARLSAARAAVGEIAERHDLPVENLLSPDALRRVMWEPPVPMDAETIASALRARGARLWQVALTAAPLAAAMPDPDGPAPASTAGDPAVPDTGPPTS